MKIVFIVDDSETNLRAAKQALEGIYKTYEMTSTSSMFKLLEKITPHLVLLDIDMPEMTGLEAMAILNQDPKTAGIPVVLLTTRFDEESEIRGFEMGALDFISKPFSPPVLLRRIGMLIDADKIVKENLISTEELYKATISAIVNLVDSREYEIGEHVERTKKYMMMISKHIMEKADFKDVMSKLNIDALCYMSLLHDIGKISVSDTILNKHGRLTSSEFEIVKNHCVEGEKIIDKIISKSSDRKDLLIYAKNIAGMHHEKWDGTGYPKGLKETEICLEARIFAVVNVYDALTNKRPYRDAFTHEQAVEIIREESGKHFEPKIVEAFLEISEDFWAESISM